MTLYQYDWQQGHRAVKTVTTGEAGVALFPVSPGMQGKSFFLLAHKGEDLSLDTSYLGFYDRGRPGETTATLFYTDRSIYRPGQKLYWKALAYRIVRREGLRRRAIPPRPSP